jgi:signal transduction histidine kinase
MKLSNEVKLALIGILREAVANISHHSNGNEAEIMLHQILGYTELKIYDNGVIDKDEAQRIISNLCSEDRRESGIGLINIKDRVEDLGGDLNIYMDQGFTLFVRVPIK